MTLCDDEREKVGLAASATMAPTICRALVSPRDSCRVSAILFNDPSS